MWDAAVVDVASAEGVREAGFPNDYPATTPIVETQAAATRWHADRREGVVCRSHAMYLAGEREWREPHEPWSEVAIFVRNTKPPTPGKRYLNVGWLDGRLTD